MESEVSSGSHASKSDATLSGRVTRSVYATVKRLRAGTTRVMRAGWTSPTALARRTSTPRVRSRTSSISSS